MSSQNVIDLPAFGASAATIATRLADGLDSTHIPDVDEALAARLVTSPLFEVRGLGDVDLNAQLLARAAIDYGFRVLHVTVLAALARECLPLIDNLEGRLPTVVALETSIVRGDRADPTAIVLRQATPEGFRNHVTGA